MDKINSAILYEIRTGANKIKHTLKNVFSKFKPDWKSRYLLARRVTLDTNLVMLQYDLLINVLFLNNMHFSFKNVNFPPRLYCSEEEETPAFSFHSYLETETL